MRATKLVALLFAAAAIYAAHAASPIAAGAQNLPPNTNDPIGTSGNITTTGGAISLTPNNGLNHQTSCSADVQGTWTGALLAQVSQQWQVLNVTPLNSTITQSSINGDGVYQFSISGLSQVRIVGPTSTGSALVYLFCQPSGGGGISMFSPLSGFSFDGSSNLLVNVATAQPFTVNTPPPYPTYLGFGYGGMLPIGPSAEPTGAPFNSAYDQTISSVGAASVSGGTADNVAAASINPVLTACKGQSITNNPFASSGDRVQRDTSCDLTGNTFVRPGSSNPIDCQVTFSAAGTSQCQGVTGSSTTQYITDIDVVPASGASSVTVTLKYSTGMSCGTPTAFTITWNVPSTGFDRSFTMPATSFTDAVATCVTIAGSSINGTEVELHGFIAP